MQNSVPPLFTYQIGKYKKIDNSQLRRGVWSRYSHMLLMEDCFGIWTQVIH